MKPEVHRGKPRGRFFGDDAQDTATAQRQHQLALAAYNAKQTGDFATYSQAIQGLYALGFENVSDADLKAMLDIATTPQTNPFAFLTTPLILTAVIVGGLLLWQSGALKQLGRSRGK